MNVGVQKERACLVVSVAYMALICTEYIEAFQQWDKIQEEKHRVVYKVPVWRKSAYKHRVKNLYSPRPEATTKSRTRVLARGTSNYAPICRGSVINEIGAMGCRTI